MPPSVREPAPLGKMEQARLKAGGCACGRTESAGWGAGRQGRARERSAASTESQGGALSALPGARACAGHARVGTGHGCACASERGCGCAGMSACATRGIGATSGTPPLSPRDWVPCGLATHHISPHSRPLGTPPPCFHARGPKYLVQVLLCTRKCICCKHLRNRTSVSKRRASVVVVDMWKTTTRIR